MRTSTRVCAGRGNCLAMAHLPTFPLAPVQPRQARRTILLRLRLRRAVDYAVTRRDAGSRPDAIRLGSGYLSKGPCLPPAPTCAGTAKLAGGEEPRFIVKRRDFDSTSGPSPESDHQSQLPESRSEVYVQTMFHRPATAQCYAKTTSKPGPLFQQDRFANSSCLAYLQRVSLGMSFDQGELSLKLISRRTATRAASSVT